MRLLTITAAAAAERSRLLKQSSSTWILFYCRINKRTFNKFLQHQQAHVRSRASMEHCEIPLQFVAIQTLLAMKFIVAALQEPKLLAAYFRALLSWMDRAHVLKRVLFREGDRIDLDFSPYVTTAVWSRPVAFSKTESNIFLTRLAQHRRGCHRLIEICPPPHNKLYLIIVWLCISAKKVF